MAAIPLLLRDAQPEDATAIAELFLAARRAAMPWLPTLHSDADTHAWIAAVVVPHARVRVAVADGRIAGFLAREDDVVAHLYVDPGRQGRGVGSALLGEAQAEGRPLSLHVFERNGAARRFYSGRGFVVAGRRDGSANEEGLPDLVMAWAPPRP
ncbi:MAG: GNAT family N-acetyltransferase [Alphaproteobacteria bacterium]|nr:GNAT family N-acetyltransferase [Alphaproteobacteria bacterium]